MAGREGHAPAGRRARGFVRGRDPRQELLRRGPWYDHHGRKRFGTPGNPRDGRRHRPRPGRLAHHPHRHKDRTWHDEPRLLASGRSWHLRRRHRGERPQRGLLRRGLHRPPRRLRGGTKCRWQGCRILDGRVEGEEELGKVSVVGTGMLNRPGYAARMFATLGEAGIPIRLVSTSEIQVTCVLPAGRVEEAVRVLHRDFELEERDV